MKLPRVLCAKRNDVLLGPHFQTEMIKFLYNSKGVICLPENNITLFISSNEFSSYMTATISVKSPKQTLVWYPATGSLFIK